MSSRESKYYGKMRNIEIDRNNSNEFIICCLMCKKLKDDDFNEFNIIIKKYNYFFIIKSIIHN